MTLLCQKRHSEGRWGGRGAKGNPMRIGNAASNLSSGMLEVARRWLRGAVRRKVGKLIGGWLFIPDTLIKQTWQDVKKERRKKKVKMCKNAYLYNFLKRFYIKKLSGFDYLCLCLCYSLKYKILKQSHFKDQTSGGGPTIDCIRKPGLNKEMRKNNLKIK